MMRCLSRHAWATAAVLVSAGLLVLPTGFAPAHAQQAQPTQQAAVTDPASLPDQEIGRRFTVKPEDLPPPHTGPVVAGIVGVKKFAYDIWGDTVNIASRMESSGEAGKVNISGSTYELVKDKFNCTYRGKIEAKNKGEIDMYFVEDVS